MTAVNHALTGTVVALLAKKPELAIPLAFLSHFAVDVVPHFDARKMPRRWTLPFIGADLLAGHLLAILLPLLLSTNVSGWLIFVCIIAAMSPDYVWCWRFLKVMDADKTFEGKMSWFSRLHQRLQWSDSLEGILVEAGWATVMVYLLFQLAE